MLLQHQVKSRSLVLVVVVAKKQKIQNKYKKKKTNQKKMFNCFAGFTHVPSCLIIFSPGSVCSNPGQPCACNSGLGRRRSRQLTSSSTVYRNTTASIQPVLPPPNNSLYGFAYVDSTGNSTHVYTPIPVPL